MKKALVASIAVVSLLSTTTTGIGPAIAASTSPIVDVQDMIINGMVIDVTDSVKTVVDSSFKDIVDHWAESSIVAAIKQGIVSGYPDGLFHPENMVTRAEFIKMSVVAMELPINNNSQSDNWYVPYIDSAKTIGLYKEGDFSSGDMTKQMSRLDMVHIAVRAIGETAKDDNEFMLIAVKKGLISGTGNGKLDPDGTTTRAQAVTVIQRIQKVKSGMTLPVDEKAVANAESAMNAKKDAWGLTIRTTNLPKNAKDYAYILEQYPNDMYEMAYPQIVKTMPAILSKTNKFVRHKPTMEAWKKNTEEFYNLLLNVDYRTINDKWAEDLFSHYNQSNVFVFKDMKEYVSWVKKNKIITEGSLIAEPSMVSAAEHVGLYYIRTKFTFKISSYTEYKDIFFDEYFKSRGKFTKGSWYEGYADIPLSTNVGGSHLRQIDGQASLFRLTNIVRKKN
ncbi:S-layer homology domain-containing protein [Paenibacillus sp. NPDC093718]|uniref:S-layer homology domain-containing protein n=1 Tax=Paenibacillus sp. NPDC093718 TaxID=3390601 RepID=UPI003CFDF53C